MMQRRLVSTALALAEILMMGAGLLACQSKPKQISIGLPPSVAAYGLVYIASTEGFFARNGLNVTIKEYDSGLAAVRGMLSGEKDIAGAAEYPIVGNAFNKDRVRIFASISKGGSFFVTARKDHGIETIADLKGKRIGVTFQTINEFYLGRFLNLNGIPISEVTRVNLPLAKLENALASDSIDAVISREPYFSSIQKRLGTSEISWPAQSGQLTSSLLVSRADWIREHPELVSRFLKSMAQAEDYTIRNPKQAKATVQKWMNQETSAIETEWSQVQFSLSLDQSLITAMEDEARWMIKNKLIKEKNVPNFLDYVYEDGLRAVKPEAVNIIR
jgi:NitT/TauT family transport system substrate-binding protein